MGLELVEMLNWSLGQDMTKHSNPHRSRSPQINASAFVRQVHGRWEDLASTATLFPFEDLERSTLHQTPFLSIELYLSPAFTAAMQAIEREAWDPAYLSDL